MGSTIHRPGVPQDHDPLLEYVRDIIADAIRNGTVEAGIGLECFLYALNPELVSALRQFAALDPLVRRELLVKAKLMTGSECDSPARQPLLQ
jgi:hypothetical protein